MRPRYGLDRAPGHKVYTTFGPPHQAGRPHSLLPAQAFSRVTCFQPEGLRMRNTLLALVVALTIAVPASGQDAEVMADPQATPGRAAPGCSQVQDYVPGTAVAGEFTVSDCFTLNGGLRQPTD